MTYLPSLEFSLTADAGAVVLAYYSNGNRVEGSVVRLTARGCHRLASVVADAVNGSLGRASCAIVDGMAVRASIVCEDVGDYVAVENAVSFPSSFISLPLSRGQSLVDALNAVADAAEARQPATVLVS